MLNGEKLRVVSVSKVNAHRVDQITFMIDDEPQTVQLIWAWQLPWVRAYLNTHYREQCKKP